MTWHFDWLRSWEEIWDAGHLSDWRSLIAGGRTNATPFMHPDVIRAWLDATGGEAAYDPFFLAARHAGGQRVLWLLVRQRGGWGSGFQRAMVPAGSVGLGGPHFAYNDPLVAPVDDSGSVLAPGFWSGLERELRRREGDWFDVCSVPRLRTTCLGGVDARPTAQSSTWVSLAPYADFGAYLAARRPSMLKDIERKSRRLDAAGRHDFHVHGPGEAEAVLAWLPDLVEATAARYPDTEVPAAFMRALVHRCLDSGVVHGSVVRLEGQPISWRLSYVLDGTLYCGMRCFDPRFERLSPGLLHSYRSMEWLFGQGGRAYDALIGQQAYKYDWTDGDEHALHRWRVESRARGTHLRRQARRIIARLGGRGADDPSVAAG